MASEQVNGRITETELRWERMSLVLMQCFLLVRRSAVTGAVRAQGAATLRNAAQAEMLVPLTAEDRKQRQGISEAGF